MGDKRTDVGKKYTVVVAETFEVIVGGASLKLTSNGSITITGTSIDIGASGPIHINGKDVDIN